MGSGIEQQVDDDDVAEVDLAHHSQVLALSDLALDIECARDNLRSLVARAFEIGRAVRDVKIVAKAEGVPKE